MNDRTMGLCICRLMIFVRIGVFVLFFKWRISTGPVVSSTDSKQTSRAGVRAVWTVSVAGELWFALMWVMDQQLPKMWPVRRAVDVAALGDTVLSILAADYPADKLTCYVSDDGGALLMLTREALTEAAGFAGLWVPFCRKHGVEPRSPEAFFFGSGAAAAADGRKARVATRAGYKGNAWPELAPDRRRVRRAYEELRRSTCSRPATSGAGGCRRRRRMEAAAGGDMARPTTTPELSIEVQIGRPSSRAPQLGGGIGLLELSSVDVRLSALVYVYREQRRGRAHHRKADAMNALLDASAVLSNAAFVLNIDCDHYVNNSQALRAGVCLMLDRGGGGGGGAPPTAPPRRTRSAGRRRSTSPTGCTRCCAGRRAPSRSSSPGTTRCSPAAAAGSTRCSASRTSTPRCTRSPPSSSRSTASSPSSRLSCRQNINF
ncbi:hypothetical protein ACP4OV_005626 [Aristida adscensionis]